MSRRTSTERDWRPTQTSTALAVATTALVVGALLYHIEDVLVPALVGSVGALLFTLSCWLLAREDRPFTALVVSLLTVPVAFGLLAGVVLVVLSLSGKLFPVPDASLVSVSTLIVVGHAGIVLGSMLAVLGFALGYWNVLRDGSLTRYSKVAFVTGFVPALVSTALVVNGTALEQGRLSEVGAVISGAVGWLVSPQPTNLHLTGFLLVVAVAVGSLYVAVTKLPVSELLADEGGQKPIKQRVQDLTIQLQTATVLSATLFAAALLFELATDPEQVLGSGLYTTVQGLTTADGLRKLFLAVAIAAGLTTGVGLLARRTAQESTGTSADELGPILGGGVITLVALTVADSVYHGTAETVAEPMPASISTEVYRRSDRVAEVYGEETIVVLLALALVTVTLLLVVALRFALHVGYLSRATTGYSLASGGLFVATVFAATIDAPTWLVFGGILASLFVWDTGRFATTLGREVGRVADTQSAELTHAGGTLFVGILGVLAAVGVTNVISASTATLSPTMPVALLAVVAGILSLIAALR